MPPCRLIPNNFCQSKLLKCESLRFRKKTQKARISGSFGKRVQFLHCKNALRAQKLCGISRARAGEDELPVLYALGRYQGVGNCLDFLCLSPQKHNL